MNSAFLSMQIGKSAEAHSKFTSRVWTFCRRYNWPSRGGIPAAIAAELGESIYTFDLTRNAAKIAVRIRVFNHVDFRVRRHIAHEGRYD